MAGISFCHCKHPNIEPDPFDGDLCTKCGEYYVESGPPGPPLPVTKKMHAAALVLEGIYWVIVWPFIKFADGISCVQDRWECLFGKRTEKCVRLRKKK